MSLPSVQLATSAAAFDDYFFSVVYDGISPCSLHGPSAAKSRVVKRTACLAVFYGMVVPLLQGATRLSKAKGLRLGTRLKLNPYHSPVRR